ncbi:Mitochondrial genome maintenance protein mgm101 homolog [Geodia barretti]|uniref:Mitochondrial genome maintenance protein mgm101 homolog n=1 Tax=Geodia barretti TaxID=519541 RepID=A0AA35RD32_GEOBA|nr:Mitochondrial genome maintenance protein mgm101 homolog [Geodia barretti]
MAFRVIRALRPTAASLRYLRPYNSHNHLSSASSPASSNELDETQVKETTITEGRSIDDPYFGISTSTFPQRILSVLLHPVNEQDVEIKPDGLIYLPEIKYRRILNQAFGPGGWALMPRGNEGEGAQLITREYSLYCHGRFISQATGEHTFYSKSNLSYGKACESAKSNALTRCCKDLGIASELWDPQFVSKWKKQYSEEAWCENVRNKEKKRLWRKASSGETFPYPWKEMGPVKSSNSS